MRLQIVVEKKATNYLLREICAVEEKINKDVQVKQLPKKLILYQESKNQKETEFLPFNDPTIHLTTVFQILIIVEPDLPKGIILHKLLLPIAKLLLPYLKFCHQNSTSDANGTRTKRDRNYVKCVALFAVVMFFLLGNAKMCEIHYDKYESSNNARPVSYTISDHPIGFVDIIAAEYNFSFPNIAEVIVKLLTGKILKPWRDNE